MSTFAPILQPPGASDAPPVTLALNVPRELEAIARELAELKLALDRFSRTPTGQPFLNDWFVSPTGTCAFDGREFIERIVPFLGHSKAVDRPFRAFVDPTLVLGANINGRPESIRGDDIARRRARYAHDFDVSGLERADYQWLEPLGIVWAHEGKHRVAFMRMHGESAIAAWVTRRGYPTPERLILVKPANEREDWFAILDGRYLQEVPHPALTQRLLTAYGVPTVHWRDLEGVPSESFARHAIVEWRARPRTFAEADRTLDLRALRDEEQRQSEPLVRTVAELAREGWQVQYGRQLAYAAAALGAGALLKLVFQGGRLQDLGLVCMGVGIGLSAVTSTLRIVGPRSRRGRDV
ncbi:hypothetical protein [Burkholderia cepacia]|uniref:hypothetical protein n=1 Tax=Burkholderia cepacia TaxID=292 RepID=UPI001CF1D14C|nr:hypothetical protein [Burkholderia cepacia]MCA7940715.1 hypothetical protein [Burkholderia cepacia]